MEYSKENFINEPGLARDFLACVELESKGTITFKKDLTEDEAMDEAIKMLETVHADLEVACFLKEKGSLN